MGDAVQLQVARLGGPVVEQQHGAAVAGEAVLQRQDLPTVAQRGLRQQVQLGLALMDEAGEESTPVRRAITFRNGLMLSTLAARPLRCIVTMIELGCHLVRVGVRWQLVFAAEETKSRRLIELPWPDRLNLLLERYLEQHRPVLLGEQVSNRLWLSCKGRPISGKSFHALITTITRKRFGQPSNPTFFRDCFATSIAVRDPEHIGVAAILLGHSQRTNEKHYNQAQTLEAGRMYQRSLLTLRRQLALPPPLEPNLNTPPCGE